MISLLLLTSIIYSQQCNKNNWKDYYNKDSKNMTGCNLREANLAGVDLTGANLRKTNLTEAKLKGADISGVKSGEIKGEPSSLPDGWSLVDGQLIQNE